MPELPNPKRYRKKLVEVEAVQVTDRNGAEVEAWAGDKAESYDVGMAPGQTHHVKVETPHGTKWAKVGYYVIRERNGDLDVQTGGYFQATYEPVEGGKQAPGSEALNPEEARELFSLWLANGMRPPEIDPGHPLYTGAMKLGAMQPDDCRPELVEEGGGEEIEACVSRCPVCKRYSVDRVGVSKSLSCFFNGHDTADYEVVATINGPLARVALDLNRIENIQTDAEWLYDAKEKTGTVDRPGASAALAVRALEHLISAHPQLSTEEGEGARKATEREPVRDLVKAGALIAAEIDRLQREEAR